MIEIRLCSIKGAKWLDSVSQATGAILKPPSGLGLMFGRAIAYRLRQVKTGAELRASGVEGLVLALDGIKFNVGLLVSALRAVACASLVSGVGDDQNADLLEGLFTGRKSLVKVPACLTTVGVIGGMLGGEGQRFGDWMASVDQTVLTDEIRNMHGEEAVNAYLAAIDDLRRICAVATRIHGCDVCCLKLPEFGGHHTQFGPLSIVSRHPRSFGPTDYRLARAQSPDGNGGLGLSVSVCRRRPALSFLRERMKDIRNQEASPGTR